MRPKVVYLSRVPFRVALQRAARDDRFLEIGKTTSYVVFTGCFVLVERLVERGS